MQESFSKNSFIPKKSIDRSKRVRGRKRVYVLTYLSYCVFFGTIVATLFVFLYSAYLQRELDGKVAQLTEQRKTYDQADLRTIEDWEYKLRVAEYFYGNHVSPYRILADLEQYTAEDIRFSGISYAAAASRAEGEGEKAKVTLKGESERFDSVAFQDAAFEQGSVFADAAFTSVTKTIPGALDDQANQNDSGVFTKPVNFQVSLDLSPQAIAYDIAAYQQPVTTDSSSAEFELGAETIDETLSEFDAEPFISDESLPDANELEI